MASIKKALYGSNKNQIRSPTIKRSLSSSVILQGWLYKQGSDGLMLWKKRWFVLADYCLFYYKGPAEEKLLGSCLLASYKISPCTSEDKIYRKFSFKAEHANMRTYYFSAESQASMIQWINALSLASICQENQSDNLEGGVIDSWVVSEHQPLYANAPPKPRRAVESPELVPKRMCPEKINGEDPNYLVYQSRGGAPFNDPLSHIHSYPQMRPTNQVPYGSSHYPVKYEQNNFVYQAPPVIHSKLNEQFSNPASSHSNVYNNYSNRIQPGRSERVPLPDKKFPPRPHSADFLEHDMKEGRQMNYQNEVSKYNDIGKLQRPKSSLDVIRYNDFSYDSLHWSEEAYAEKMRQTSLYVAPHFKACDRNNMPVAQLPKDAGDQQSVDIRVYPQQLSDSRFECGYNDGTKFNRSASARFPLPTKTGNSYLGYDGTPKIKIESDDRDGKGNLLDEREESMRRLLVWKRRMLQSPLTRKPSSGSASQSLIPSKIESSSFHRKFSTKDENSDHSTNSTLETSSNHKSENYSEKVQIRKKNHTKDNPKFHYHSLSSDEDDIARTFEGRKHSHKPYCKKNISQSDNMISSSCNAEQSDSSASRINLNLSSSYLNSHNIVAGPSRTETHSSSQSNHFEQTSCDSKSDVSSSDAIPKSALPMLTCHDYKTSVDSSSMVECQSPVSSKPSDSGYSTLQNGILLKNSHGNSLDLTQCGANYSFDSTNETDTVQDVKKEWGLKLDESRVIKEFSYHYINSQNEDSKRSLWSVDEENSNDGVSESRVKADFEKSNCRDTVDTTSNPSSAVSVDVFSLKGSSIKSSSINADHLDDITNHSEGNILVDLDRTELDKTCTDHDAIGKTSHTLDENFLSQGPLSSQVIKTTDGSISSELSRDTLFPSSVSVASCCNAFSSDEDRDEEVAAVLGKHKKNSFNGQCHKSDNANSNFVGEVENSETDISTSSANLFSVMTPENLGEKLKEEHYMPMTPKKKLIASPDNESAFVSRNASASSFYATENSENLLEESSYVEMSHNSTSSSNNGIRSFKPSGTGSVTPGSSDLQLFEDNPDYEYISKDLTSEPVYVELSSSFRDKKSEHLKSKFSKVPSSKNSKDQLYYSSLKHSLPDILNTSSPQCPLNSTKSDSSDADDEASKDLECITTPTHPRFSLSDTFRPASYYLGTNHSAGTFIGLNFEQQDSSDSDLVSPPPIPVSTPPVDELDLSLDLVKRCNLLSSKEDKDEILNDQSSYWKTLPGDLGHKQVKISNIYLSSRPVEDLSSETDSVGSFRKEQMLKRRPVSADILDNLCESNLFSSSPSSRRKSIGSDIESIGFSNTEDLSVNCEHFLEDLQVNDQFLESLVKNSSDNISNLLKINPSSEKQSSIDSRFKINNVIWEYEKKRNELGSGVSESIYEKYFKHAISMNQPMSRSSGIPQNKLSDNNQSGAPYYYSDIFKSGSADQTVMTAESVNSNQSSSSPTLNNNKLKKMKNNIVNASYCSKKDNYFRQCSPKHSSGNNNAHEDLGNDKNNVNSSNVSYNETKAISSKLLGRSLTPDFHTKVRSSALHGNARNIKMPSNGAVSVGATENSSLRRSRSFDGLLDDEDLLEEKPRILRASPSNAIFKLLQTTQGSNQEYSDKAYSLQAHSDFYVKQNQSRSTAAASDHDKSEEKSLRLARSLDNLEWYSDSPSTRKPFIPRDNIASSPLPREVHEYQIGENVMAVHDPSTCYRLDEKRCVNSMSDSPTTFDFHSSKGIERSSSCVLPEPQVKQSLHPTRLPYEGGHEKHSQWDSVTSSPCVFERPQDKPGVSLSACGNVSSPNSTVSLTVTAGDNWNLELSAGELLGRTHEELVLLLIQLRRRSSGLCKAIDDFQKEITSKVKIMEQDPSKRLESSIKREELKRHLLDLEKQYEKGKPLVNLVDNMVKLGSLYHSNMNLPSSNMPQKREFNHKVQEQRLLAEEKKEWERLYPDQKQLQEKVKQLYRLDQILQKESDTLQNLQQDKAALEQALLGLRQRLDAMHGNPVETEHCRHQQRMLEKGLTRVRSILAQNSKKLEETVAENARLEQELVILRQKLQISRRTFEPGSTTVALESELKRVQDLVGDLQRQRQDLCLQVRQLTEKSNSLSQQIQPPTYDDPGAFQTTIKRRTSSSWVETDLDSQITQDVGVESYHTQQSSHATPVFTMCGDPNKKMCIIHKEKPQEIKTVRIVKRESERRQRDRERNGALGIPLIAMVSRRETIVEESSGSSSSNETIISQNIANSFENTSGDAWSTPQMNSNPPPLNPRTDSVNAVKNFMIKHKELKDDVLMSKAPSVESEQTERHHSPEESAPVYLSKAAQEIVQEVAWRKKGEKRLVTKEKRRYHTVSGQSIFQEFSAFASVGSRDDLDMERALRNRVHAPDVVRSTLSRDAKFTAETIDNILGTPNKIVIPERYIPETEPQVSKEEQLQRSRKAEAIRKMLTQSSTITSESTESHRDSNYSAQYKDKIAEEKQQREHLLQLNQILAQQVIEKSKVVAGGHSSVSMS